MADEQTAALIAILALDEQDIRDGNYQDFEEFFAELDAEDRLDQKFQR